MQDNIALSCIFDFGPEENGRRVAECRNCHRKINVPIESGTNIVARCLLSPRPIHTGGSNLIQQPAAYGPGTELESIFKEANAPSDVCSGLCAEWRNRMNGWGVVGCRSHRQEIVDHLWKVLFKTWLSRQQEAGWTSFSIARQPWFRVLDPVGCIVDESIYRAEEKTTVPASPLPA